MQTIIMSIKPKYWQQIVAGTKKVEYRKRLWQDKTASTKIIVYATAPISKIVGEFVTGNIISDRYPSLWLKTKAVGGISADDYFDYFAKSPIAHAIVSKTSKFMMNLKKLPNLPKIVSNEHHNLGNI